MATCDPARTGERAAIVAPKGPHRTRRLRWSILDPSREAVPADLRRAWSELAGGERPNPFSLYQTPEMVRPPGRHRPGGPGPPGPRSRRARRGRGHRPRTRSTAGGSGSTWPGGSACRPRRSRWSRSGAAGRSCPRSLGAIEGLVEILSAGVRGPVGLDLFGVAESSWFLRALGKSDAVRRDFFGERREALDRIDLIPLPRSFGEFLAKYDAKKRYNLRRQARLLREHAGGDLVLDRVARPDDVPGFLASVAALGVRVGPESPASEEARLVDLARRGPAPLLRPQGRGPADRLPDGQGQGGELSR